MINPFQLSGRYQRIEFILVFWFSFSILLRSVFNLNHKSYYFFEIKLIIDFIALASFTPVMFRRLHDINLPGYLLVLFWLGIPFNMRNLVYLNTKLDIELNPFSTPVVIMEFINLFLLIMLVFYRSYPHCNRWGCPNKQLNMDSGADAPPPVS